MSDFNSNYTFDGNEINMVTPIAGLTDNGYAINSVPASGNINFLLNRATRPYGNNMPTGTRISGWFDVTDPNITEHWIHMLPGITLGSGASPATFAGDVYRDLYVILWNRCSDTACPVSGGRGVDALSDFGANKTIALPDVSNNPTGARANNTGGGFPEPGDTEGAKTHTLTEAEMPTHTHVQNTSTLYEIATPANSAPFPGSGVVRTAPGTPTEATGGGAAHNIIQPTLYEDWMIKY